MKIPQEQLDKTTDDNDGADDAACHDYRRFPFGPCVVGIRKWCISHAGHSFSSSSVISTLLVSYFAHLSQKRRIVALVGVQYVTTALSLCAFKAHILPRDSVCNPYALVRLVHGNEARNGRIVGFEERDRIPNLYAMA